MKQQKDLRKKGSNKAGYFAVIALIIILSSATESYSQAYSTGFTQNTIVSGNGTSIVIYRDSYSPTSIIHIAINAPDFNSNPYAIDTIGDDPENKIIISTRESSISYRLVETGTNTGVFAGYVTLSGTTSTCSPVCGPTDGFLMASGDDGITVSFTYGKDQTITNTLTGSTQDRSSEPSVPEFGSLASFIVTISVIIVLIFSRRFVKNH